MLTINHLINSLAKQRKKAPQERTPNQPTSLFRQEACGYSDALDCHTIDVEVDVIAFPPTIDRREPIVARIGLGFNTHIPEKDCGYHR